MLRDNRKLNPMLAANRIENLKRRVERARQFPGNTCPASRHLHLMALGLASKRGYVMLLDEPEHCAGSMLSVLESLWKLRTQYDRLRLKRDGKRKQHNA